MTDLMQRLANERSENLVAMVESRPEDGFEPEVIDAARYELAKRAIDTRELSDVTNNQKTLQVEEDSRSQIPLSNAAWLSFVALGPILILTIPLVFSLRDQGYKQKGKDAVSGILAGFFLWGVGVPGIFLTLDWLGIM